MSGTSKCEAMRVYTDLFELVSSIRLRGKVSAEDIAHALANPQRRIRNRKNPAGLAPASWAYPVSK